MIKPSRTSLGSWLALAAGLLAGASLVWFVGPLLVLRDWRPLETVAARALLIAAMLLLPLAAALWRHLRGQRLARQAALPADMLDSAVDQALLRLRARPAIGSPGWRGALARWQQWNGPDPLLALPWVLVIGLPGADKRRALAAAGYELPLRSTAEPPCTWCITPRGVLIDVAEPLLNLGQADWLRLLRRLKHARPLQPLSAVLLMLPATERGGPSPVDLAPSAAPLQARLSELVQITGLVPPVHLAFTACERLAGHPSADAQQRLQAAADALALASPPPLRPVVLLHTDPAALRRLIDEQVLAPPARPLFAQGWLRKQRWLVRAGYAATVLVVGALAAGWSVSREQNQLLMARQQAQLPTIQAALDAARPALASNDVSTLLVALNRMQQTMRQAQGTPSTARLGLFQGDKLQAAADTAYQRLLRDSLAPALLHRLALRLRNTVAQGDQADDALYDMLRLYLVLLQNRSDLDPKLAADLATREPQYFGLPDALQQDLAFHVGALVAAGGAPALSVDIDLVEEAQQLLATRPLDRLLVREMGQRHAAEGRPQLSVQEMVGTADADLFARRSGRPLSDGVPTLYTQNGIDRYVAPVLKDGTLERMRQVLRLVLRSKQIDLPGNQPAAPDEQVRTAALQRYLADYTAAWDALLADVQLVDNLNAKVPLPQRVNAEDSPVAKLMRVAAAQTAPSPRLLALSPAASIEQVDKHFASLQRMVAGQPPPLDAGLAQLADVVNAMRSINTPRSELTVLINQLPRPLRQLLVLDAGSAAAASNAGNASGSEPVAAIEFNTLQQQCQRGATNRYPLVATAKAEMSLADFSALFGAGSGFDAYFQRWLAPLVDVSTRPWAWRPGTAAQRPVPAAALASFEQAARIRGALFSGSTRQPSLSVALSVLALDDRVSAVELRLNEQFTQLRVGDVAKFIDWPGQPALQRISLGAAGGKAPELSFEGPWALPRLMDALTLQPSRAPQRYFAKLLIGGQPAELNLVTASAFDLGKAQLRAFRCPVAADLQGTAPPSKGGAVRRIDPGAVADDAIKQMMQKLRR